MPVWQLDMMAGRKLINGVSEMITTMKRFFLLILIFILMSTPVCLDGMQDGVDEGA